jgi:PTS system nitrogen regulatory IIA component
MTIAGLLAEARVHLGVRAADKAGALAALARLVADLPAGGLLQLLAAREALGSTGVGGGIALPHARVAGLRASSAWFVRLAQPIDFAAIDGRKVDLLVLLLSPAGEDRAHLTALAAVSRRLRAPGVAEALRRAATAAEAHAILTG